MMQQNMSGICRRKADPRHLPYLEYTGFPDFNVSSVTAADIEEMWFQLQPIKLRNRVPYATTKRPKPRYSQRYLRDIILH